MANEIFRFVNFRPPRMADPSAGASGISLEHAGNPTPLIDDLATLKRNGQPRRQFEARARRYVTSDDYALGPVALPLDVAAFAAWVDTQGARLSSAGVREWIRRTWGQSVPELLAGEAYAETRRRLADSLIALTIASGTSTDRSRMARWMRTLAFLEQVKDTASDNIDVDRAKRRPLLLPAGVFPLPRTENPHDDVALDAAEERKNKYEEWRKDTLQITAKIAQQREAIREIAAALRTDTNELRKALASPPAIPSPSEPRATDPGRRLQRPPSAGLPTAVLSNAAAARLSRRSKSALESIAVSEDFIDVQYATQVFETAIGEALTTLLRNGRPRTVTRIGNQWVPVPIEDPIVTNEGGWREPGPCEPVISDVPVHSEPTVPATTMSDLRPVGIADLMQVRQDVKRYALGEVAHIENVVRGESRERTHRQATRVTETITVETERLTEESRDLQTTERFELQQETNDVLREESSREVAVSISASYGPFAEASANITSAQATSREESNKTATRFSREVTDKAVKRIQDRVIERRTITTEREVEEISKHGFDNSTGTEHVRGIYRWVDKVYEAQVVSYGLRMMFEMVVPEPAALYRHALGALPPEGLTLDRPDPPGYCVHPSGHFAPLLPSDLNEGNYQFWVSKYGVTGVEPPPPAYKTIGISVAQEPAAEDPFVTFTNTELQVPSGYRAERAFVSGDFLLWDTTGPDEFITFHVGRVRLGVNTSGPMNGEDGMVPVVGHGYSVAMVGVTIEVLCARGKEAFESWQLATHGAIIGAYNDLKSQYEAARARIEANIQASALIVGRNPLINREIERMELKRAALSLLTGQHFDDFDAMRRDVPPHGYPRMDLAEATAEGAYIRFFEQAFEWANISYRFYPYFWGRKSEWPALLRFDDTDPLFGRFLQAGAARVQVPVRPGFEEAVLYLLQTGNKPWEEEDTAFLIDGPLYVAMVDEIKEESRGAFTRGQGTVSVQQNSRVVTGTGTAFEASLHVDRDIVLRERTYRVTEVTSATELVLDRAYESASAAELPYAFGARHIGDAWEVRVPTTLVMLQKGGDLPDLAAQDVSQ
jgi:hypothetical protein